MKWDSHYFYIWSIYTLNVTESCSVLMYQLDFVVFATICDIWNKLLTRAFQWSMTSHVTHNRKWIERRCSGFPTPLATGNVLSSVNEKSFLHSRTICKLSSCVFPKYWGALGMAIMGYITWPRGTWYRLKLDKIGEKVLHNHISSHYDRLFRFYPPNRKKTEIVGVSSKYLPLTWTVYVLL